MALVCTKMHDLNIYFPFFLGVIAPDPLPNPHQHGPARRPPTFSTNRRPRFLQWRYRCLG